jgi:hypothetical protein
LIRAAAALLAEARGGLRRLTPSEALEAMRAGWVEGGLPVVPYGSGQVTRAIAGGPEDPLPGTYA